MFMIRVEPVSVHVISEQFLTDHRTRNSHSGKASVCAKMRIQRITQNWFVRVMEAIRAPRFLSFSVGISASLCSTRCYLMLFRFRAWSEKGNLSIGSKTRIKKKPRLESSVQRWTEIHLFLLCEFRRWLFPHSRNDLLLYLSGFF